MEHVELNYEYLNNGNAPTLHERGVATSKLTASTLHGTSRKKGEEERKLLVWFQLLNTMSCRDCKAHTSKMILGTEIFVSRNGFQAT